MNMHDVTVNDLPIGAKIIFGSYQIGGSNCLVPLTWIKVDSDNTFLSEYIVEQLAFDASHDDFDLDGCNEYNTSNVRQFLNKRGEDWWEKACPDDRPPYGEYLKGDNVGYNHLPAFLTYFDDQELEKILLSEANMYDRFFIPTKDDVVVWKYFANGASLQCKPLDELVRHTRCDEKPYQKGWFYWLSTKYRTGVNVYGVSHSDGISHYPPNDGAIGVRPAFRMTGGTVVYEYDGDYFEVMQPVNVDEDAFKTILGI